METHSTTAIAAALTLYTALRPEKIPAFHGANIYKGNLTAIDKEIPQFLFVDSVIAAAVFCRLHGREFTPPIESYSYIENILHMMGFVDSGTRQLDPQVSESNL